MKNPQCSAVQVRGYLRGLPCGNGAKFTVRGKPYCHVHYAIAAKEPHRFREAVEFEIRAEARRRMAEREREAQIDAFETGATER